MKPYAYQHAPLLMLDKRRREGGDRALIVMATGLGKTVIAAFDARKYLRQIAGRVLYLCHQKDILRQARQTFRKVLGKDQYSYGYYHGDKKTKYVVDILFSTFQTMAGAMTYFSPEEFDYVVIDETHHSHAPTYLPTVQYWRPKFLLGITATPDRTDLNDIRQFYGDELYSLPIERAIARNLLTPVSYNLMTDDIQSSELFELPAGKLSFKELNRKFFLPKRDEEIAQIIGKYSAEVRQARTIIFCTRIEHANRFARLIPNAEALHSHMPRSSYREKLRLFRSGKITTVVTVDKFNEGIDIPQANLIVFLRSTNSKTIFLQQLGRGLRRHKDKKEVVVLDFVGNCERLLLLDKLRRSITHEQELALREQESVAGDMEISSREFSFTSVAIDLLDTLQRIQRGYTKEDLIQQLQDLGRKLGRKPLQADIRQASKERSIASPPTFCVYFGSMSNALIAAGYPAQGDRIRITKEQAIEELQKLADELGRVPRQYDIVKANADGKCASSQIYRELFGSHTNAVVAAGFNPAKRLDFTREALLNQLRNLVSRLRRVPGSSDLSNESGLAGYSTFVRVFGTFQQALKEAGFEEKFPYSRQLLVQQLKDLAKKLKRVPTQTDLVEESKQGYCASPSTFAKHFGSFTEALVEAGYKSARSRASDEELLANLRELYIRNGRIPTIVDIKQDFSSGGKFSFTAYYTSFGSYQEALKQAGLRQEIYRTAWSDEEVDRLTGLLKNPDFIHQDKWKGRPDYLKIAAILNGEFHGGATVRDRISISSYRLYLRKKGK